jgi:hypothetical protein
MDHFDNNFCPTFLTGKFAYIVQKIGSTLALPCLRMLGIKGGSLSFPRSHPSNTASISKASGGTTLNDSTDPLHSRKESQRAFYRLPEDSNRDGSRTPLDAKLRPDHYGGLVTNVMGAKTDSDSLSGDEVPLHTIRVQTDFKRSDT